MPLFVLHVERDGVMEDRAKSHYGLRARDVFEWYDSLVFALGVIVLAFMFVLRVITISGSSMEPTFYSGEHVLVQSTLYEPQRGDIVVIDGYSPYGNPIIKRIIGMEGDEIDIDFSTGTVIRNGQILDEPYISAPTTLQMDVQFPVTVPEGCVFVLGDNRPGSKDSRSSDIGFLDERAILGKVLWRLTPFSRFGAVS